MHTVATNHIPGLMALISAAVTPVVLISALAIFYSALTAKHSHLSDQIRQVAAEFRKPETEAARKFALGRQLIVFERRMDALWLATGLLSLALLCFTATVLFVIWSQRTQQMGLFGVGSLLAGLIFMVAAVISELYEIGLSRTSIRYEIKDVDQIAREELNRAPR